MINVGQIGNGCRMELGLTLDGIVTIVGQNGTNGDYDGITKRSVSMNFTMMACRN